MMDALTALRRLLDALARGAGPGELTAALVDCRRVVAAADHPAIGLHLVEPVATARATDPDASHDTVASIAADVTLKAQILDVAETRLDVFDDRDLTEAIAARYGTAPDRNVVARSRGLLERDGSIRRCGSYARPDRRVATTHFRHWRTPPPAWEGHLNDR